MVWFEVYASLLVVVCGYVSTNGTGAAMLTVYGDQSNFTVMLCSVVLVSNILFSNSYSYLSDYRY